MYWKRAARRQSAQCPLLLLERQLQPESEDWMNNTKDAKSYTRRRYYTNVAYLVSCHPQRSFQHIFWPDLMGCCQQHCRRDWVRLHNLRMNPRMSICPDLRNRTVPLLHKRHTSWLHIRPAVGSSVVAGLIVSQISKFNVYMQLAGDKHTPGVRMVLGGLSHLVCRRQIHSYRRHHHMASAKLLHNFEHEHSLMR